MKSMVWIRKRNLWIELFVLLILGCVSSCTFRQPSGPAKQVTVSTVTSFAATAPGIVTTSPVTTPTIGPGTIDSSAGPTGTPVTSTASNPAVDATKAAGAIWQMLGQVDKDRALTDLRQLTGDMPICVPDGCHTITNRLTGSTGLQWAKDYLFNELVSLGYSTEKEDWSNSGYSDQNIIAKKPGMVTPNEEIYFVAHMDGVKKITLLNFPAADDNASGVVDLLEVARVLSSRTFNRTIVLLFTTGEEQGTLGVKSYISQLSQEEINSIKYVVNVDMIGYDANNDGGMELWYGGHAPSLALAQRLDETIQAYQLKLKPGFIVGCG
jgi:hypothetical protein